MDIECSGKWHSLDFAPIFCATVFRRVQTPMSRSLRLSERLGNARIGCIAANHAHPRVMAIKCRRKILRLMAHTSLQKQHADLMKAHKEISREKQDPTYSCPRILLEVSCAPQVSCAVFFSNPSELFCRSKVFQNNGNITKPMVLCNRDTFHCSPL